MVHEMCLFLLLPRVVRFIAHTFFLSMFFILGAVVKQFEECKRKDIKERIIGKRHCTISFSV